MNAEEELAMNLYQPGIDGSTGPVMRRLAFVSNDYHAKCDEVEELTARIREIGEGR